MGAPRRCRTRWAAICEKYNQDNFLLSSDNIDSIDFDIQHTDNDSITQNISLKDLIYKEKLSVRTTNVCEYNFLTDIKSILKYYATNENFLKLRNCGKKSNEELIGICKKYENLNFYEKQTYITAKPENPLIKKIDKLTTKQKAVLNNIIYSKFNQLSVRSKNALSLLLQDSITVRAIKEEFFEIENYDFKKIKNVGELTEKEIETFTNEVKELIELVSLFEDNEILREFFNSYLIKNYQVSHDTINKIGRDYDFSLGYPIFKTIYHLVDGKYLLDEKENAIFFGLLNFFYGSEPPLIKDFKSDLKLTRERFRQIRNKTLKKFPNIINGLFNLELNYQNLNTYQILQDDEFINLSDEDVLEINRNENVNFNSQFMAYIFSILLKDTHDLIGNAENVFFNKSANNQHNWNNLYLVHKELNWIFDFEKLVQDVYVRLTSKIEDDYKFYLQSYLLNFQKDNCISQIDKITSISESILFTEFEIILDSEDNILFSKNTKKQVIEYVYEVLEEKNVPLTVYEIFNCIEKKYPNISKSAEALRGSCQRDSNLIFFGRSSTYGLKKWENEKDIKGGTIRSISEEFLEQFDTPKHIIEITEYVNKFRSTNAKNIISNLKLDESQNFIFFNQSFVGLDSKKNSETYIVFENIPRFLGKKIMTKVRKVRQIDYDELLNYISINLPIGKNHIQYIVQQLVNDKYLKLENNKIIPYYED